MTVVRLLKDLGQEFGCSGDVYKNTDAQMEALKARVAKLKLKATDAFEVVKETAKADAKKVEAKVEGK